MQCILMLYLDVGCAVQNTASTEKILKSVNGTVLLNALGDKETKNLCCLAIILSKYAENACAFIF